MASIMFVKDRFMTSTDLDNKSVKKAFFHGIVNIQAKNDAPVNIEVN